VQIRNLEVGMEMKSSGVMNGDGFPTKELCMEDELIGEEVIRLKY
tara:strand:+ start:326 stop:460 length:135 start_codon:yes stop_codon:yes gene_type:complete